MREEAGQGGQQGVRRLLRDARARRWHHDVQPLRGMDQCESTGRPDILEKELPLHVSDLRHPTRTPSCQSHRAFAPTSPLPGASTGLPPSVTESDGARLCERVRSPIFFEWTDVDLEGPRRARLAG